MDGTMNAKHLVSVVIACEGNLPDLLPDLLLSLSRQTIGRNELEIILACRAGQRLVPEAESWRGILEPARLKIAAAADGASPARLRNMGLAKARGGHLLCLPAFVRLDPRFVERCLLLLEPEPDAGLAYADFMNLRGPAQGLVRLPDAGSEGLRARNIIGRVALMRRSAWESCDGFREDSPYFEWDLWVQAALRQWGLAHCGQALYSCRDERPGASFRARAEDGRAKAMLVINNHAFFKPDTVRWAVSYLRGEPWATAFRLGVIPGRPDVRRLINEHVLALSGYVPAPLDAAVWPPEAAIEPEDPEPRAKTLM
ncbi:MAG: hypothetical protein PHV85_09640 [Desulfovibrionaceae bacterium]|nr:hypothetical protein [Desulfovibrionaceae bacterium]